MQREARLFWSLITILVGATVFFAISAEQRRRAAQTGDTEALETGDIVTLGHVIDGDEVMMAKDDGTRVVVRLLGIKSFDPKRSRFGQYAVHSLQERLSKAPARARVERDKDGEPLIDDRGRVIAELLVGDQNVGLSLVEDGTVLVYTAFPFVTINNYLTAQGEARERRRGLWSDPKAVAQAERLFARWTRQKDAKRE